MKKWDVKERRTSAPHEVGAVPFLPRTGEFINASQAGAATLEAPVELQPLPADQSASRVLSVEQQIGLALLIVVTGIVLLLWPKPALITLLIALNAAYLANSVYKLRLVMRSYAAPLTNDADRHAAEALVDADLPVYTLLIPLYREAAVLPTLLGAIHRLDYPKDKLDVKLLLEEDDTETIEIVQGANLPPYIEVVIVPEGAPKGKPRACNVGLSLARGAFTTIYDAEDIPDPDQLKRVIARFQTSPASVGCVQCKLNYYNQTQNLLTRWFTAEYSMWFDLTLPGLTASNAPMPLGGTSNHFPTAVLQELGAWDPYNVTEDADLGIRLFRNGYTTEVIDSTTWEEANSHLPNWIRQRSRWVKGYIQTWLVHMRHPVSLLRALGLRGFLSFQATIGGGFFILLVNPLFWLMAVIWYLAQPNLIEELFPTAVFLLASINLFIGNFVFVYTCAAGALHRGYYSLVKYTLLLPLYWVLMSVAAWKGFLQLLYRPSYWEKTTHGLWHASQQSLVEPLLSGNGHREGRPYPGRDQRELTPVEVGITSSEPEH